ncbi:MAG: hypothetical protein HZB47_02810 [Nitrosomonadales bacterium]|nr:hypothetical protein [Nitrosomonadales bacterium]
MSLSLREELRVVLAPQQLLLVRIGRTLAWRGLTRRVLQKKAIPCGVADGGDNEWDSAVKMLAAELPGLANGTAFATVILSNHFMRYALVPWSGALGGEEEERAVARHFFRELYGSAAETWELRLSPDRAGEPQLASAVDGKLMHGVRGAFADAGIKLRSIQPSLMAAYNSCRGTLQGRSAWFVLFERGSLCLALLQQGRLGSVRTLRAGSDWRDRLALTLEREAYLAEREVTTDEIFLWAPELEKSELPQSAGWKIHALQPAIRPDFLPEYERQFAVALGG